MTPKYDVRNEGHMQIKESILIGNGLLDIKTGPEVNDALRKAGFELVEAMDLQETSEVVS